ncbi:MAG: PolC-type DNA polymerase III [Clostridia bacterium]|nr:PolC-type DNA polymerase III [Clostridia bacterium]
MKKQVKDVFFNCTNENDNNNFKYAYIDELKFSKKLNSVILKASSDKNITLDEIDEFEKNACKAYELNSFKINYEHVGSNSQISVQDVEKVLASIKKRFEYTLGILDGCTIEVENYIKEIKIELNKPYSNFLNIKKIDEYIKKYLLVQFGITYRVVICDSSECVVITDEKSKINVVKLENIAPASTALNNLEVSKSVQKSYDNTKKDYKSQYTPKSESKENLPEHVVYGKDIAKERVDKVTDVNTDYDKICIVGQIVNKDIRETKSGKMLVSIDVTDFTSTISCKMFLDKKKFEDVKDKINSGDYIKLQGRPQFDPFAKEITIMINSINKDKKPEPRKDNAENKRVELHIHTQMSAMDGVTSASDIVKQAIKWGHRAVAITDHGVAQAFPEAHGVIAKNFFSKENKNWLQDAPTKVIYGVEGYLVSDVEPNVSKSDTFCIFDIETTGFNAGIDKITEIAVAKVKNGEIIDEFSTFVNPERPIPKNVQELTKITDEMVEKSPNIEVVLPQFLKFVEDSILVAHNSKFDMSFITYFAKKQNIEVKNTVIDSLTVARELFESYENHKLGTIAQNLDISLENAHRAINDVRATVKVFLKMIEVAKSKNIDIYNYVYSNLENEPKNIPYNHIIILAKNYVGLKNLYKIISFSHIAYFHKKPRIPRSLLNRYREGLILGSACEIGELYQAIINNKGEEEIENIAKYYDYLEVQPLGNNQFHIDNGTLESVQDLIEINKKIIDLGEKLHLPVVATTDSHFLNSEDEIYRRIIMAGQGYEDADKQAPLYYRTTEEMFKEFTYLPENKKYEVVVENPNKIADMCEAIQPVPDGTFPPSIEGSDQKIEEISFENARKIYGDNLPEIVEARLKKELEPIIKYGFAVMYMIARELVKKSNEDGYLVGSRGSVGSSFVATMTGITEVNPLPPHYICVNPECKFSEFPDTTVTTGIDMNDKDCPKCGQKFKKDGMDIPFETFLGFKGDKAPDIDLNFSGDYQPVAHKYTETLFGKSKTFRAGTIGTIADKTAYGFVRKYFDEKQKSLLMPEINRLSQGCTGIKRTTGQHPGGIIVVPQDKEIYDFCPIQKPADDPFSKSVTTHFDFHSIHDNLLKLDILGHDDPTVLRMLQDITGVDPKTIPLDEQRVMSLFTTTEALGVMPEQIKSDTGTYAVPEFGTKFVRQMLMDTKPTTFGELVRISGLSHGTDVWLGNAQTLITEGTASLKEAICTRDDIMIYLIHMKLDPQMAFKIMENVRKGKGLTEDMEAAMREKEVPEWYISSCKKIKYMFPKAHAAAYVMMAYRIAYYKVYHPKEFYATYLSIRAGNFDSNLMMQGKQKIKEAIKEYEQKQNATQTEKDALTIMEVVNEMYERNINFLPVDIYISDDKKFIVESDGIRPPLSAITGFGNVDAEKLVAARKNGIFASIEELANRAKLGKVAIETLKNQGCLKELPDSAQMNFFEI